MVKTFLCALFGTGLVLKTLDFSENAIKSNLAFWAEFHGVTVQEKAVLRQESFVTQDAINLLKNENSLIINHFNKSTLEVIMNVVILKNESKFYVVEYRKISFSTYLDLKKLCKWANIFFKHLCSKNLRFI